MENKDEYLECNQATIVITWIEVHTVHEVVYGRLVAPRVIHVNQSTKGTKMSSINNGGCK